MSLRSIKRTGEEEICPVIQVLQNWSEVERATQALKQQQLPLHLTTQKNWDQWLLCQLLQKTDRQAQILDLGCGDCCTLDFLAALGFQHLHGIDLTIKPVPASRPYQLYEGNLMATPFADASFDRAVSISVIEHGVDLRAFFRETYRLLQPGGLLYLTTDYWQEKLFVEPSIQPFGLSWVIFSRSEIEQAIDIARSSGFVLVEATPIPACAERPVSWYGRDYTFIAIGFRKA